ncbi:unnamed protein product [Rotaria sp. Silwood2]|nr:unnamed protein product [Rotaria sp. Silwood2]
MGKTTSKIIGPPSFDYTKSEKISIGGRRKNVPIYTTTIPDRTEKVTPLSDEKFPRLVENTILVWLDSSLDKPTESTKSLVNQFFRVTDVVQTFHNVDQCFDFMNSIQYEKIFLIVSGSLGRQILPRIEDLDQVHSSYLFCGNKASHEEWAKQYNKIKGIHTKIKELCDAVKKDIRFYDRSLTPISILPVSSTIEINDSNKEFIYLQMVKSLLINVEYDKIFRQEFIDYSRKFYLNNESQLNIINTFDESYSLHSPIWWYTRKCFIYSMLRKAFYRQDFELIYRLGFFIRDLHRDIRKSHAQAHSHQHRAIIIYRATSMTNNEFERVEKSKGCLLSFNDFLTTTLERNMALKFVNSVHRDSNSRGIIYKITIDPVSTSIPFIALNNLSYLSSNDGDILLSMNTIFRIDNIEKIHDYLYEINLYPATKKDEEIKNLVECIQDSVDGPSGWYRLGKLLMDMKKYDIAINVYKYISTQIDDNQHEERAFLQHELGYAFDLKDNLLMSISHYKQAIEIYLTYLPPIHPTLLSTYVNLASVFERKEDFNGALQQYQNAVKIDKSDDPNIISQYNNIGRILQRQKNYPEAQKNYEKAIEILLKDFSSMHPVLADTYYNIAGMYYSMKLYSKALTYYEKTREMEEKSLILYHPKLESTYFNIATTYEGLGDNNNAIKYATKAVEVARLVFGDDHLETKENLKYLEELQEKDKIVKL